MHPTRFLLQISLVALAFSVGSTLHAATLAGTGTLSVSNGVSSGSPTVYSVTITNSIPEGSISYDIVIADPNGDNVTVDGSNRGFGEAGGGGDQFRAPGTLDFTIANVVVTPAGGSTVASQSITFDSFTLVANGANGPSTDWTSPGSTGGSGTTNAAGNSSSLETGVAGGSSISLVAVNAWSWINDGVTSYNVEFEPIPEPSATLLAGLSAGLLLLRRRRS